ncbi:MAG: DUF3131 domain-containing protein [Polaromonas sp.]|uniref:GH36-type glycosyl hydrolase domain-containing protein n=1 Tax=Polaromonas sp. TaxID=1869339 RepID=UPI00180B517C|nr:glucoamylase family protein [Polaromonas sp.]NMM10123.1 DUF3131 domain-containing protein [Polaromonas sp.]
MDASVLDRLEALTPHARKTLLSRLGEAEPPIRAELFGIQRFEEHGRSLAQAQVVEADGNSRHHLSFFPRVEENLAALREAYDYVALTSRSGHYVTPAAEWLLDNFPLVEAQLQQIREGVPRRYYASLPKLAAAPLQGLPRVYGIAWAYVAHTDSVLNPDVFTAFLNAYQQHSELRLNELWALPTTLRVVLLENLRRMADEIAQGKVAREVAHAVWDCSAQLDDAALDSLDALMKQRGLQRNYLTQLWQRMPTERLDSSPALVLWTERHCPNGHALMAESQTAQVAANLTVGNIITTLRLIGQIDWADLIEPVSCSLRLLRRLPSFALESELTRQQITQAMERLARQSRKSECEVAEAVVAAAQAVPFAMPAAAAERTAGFHLIVSGRPRLEAVLGMPGRGVATGPLPRDWRLGLYIGAIVLGTAVLLFAAAQRMGVIAWQGWIALFLLAWPASEAAAAFVHRLIAESLKMHFLPRLDFASGIPPEHRVLVVVPTLLTSAAATRELAQRLEMHWLANREQEAQFALLTDWDDAPSASVPGDVTLIQDALAHIAVLNARYLAPEGHPPRFLLIHRPRSWCETQQRWLGWERKRGKLEQLLRTLVTGSMAGFAPMAPGLRLADGIRYVVTLDSDTGLPPGALSELVSVAAHPLNAPRIDTDSRRVVGGYGILQPRIVTPLPGAAERTPYHQLFAGQCGIDPYNSGVSDVYQDLFGTGSFSGKGLIHVEAVHAVLDARLPEESVLSHDLLEGSIARCGFVSDVILIEDHPHHAGVAASRLHRWTRGDWQLLPLMWHARHYGVDALGLWKMADNLRRSLVVPATFGLLVWVVFTGAMPLSTALLATFAALLAGPLLGALAGLVPTRRGIAWRHFFHVGRNELLRTFVSALWQFSQIPAQATILLDAAFRSLWRMAVSRTMLLEWTTAAQARASSRNELAVFVRQHAAASLICAALVMAAPAGVHPLAGIALFMLWALSPLPAWWASVPSLRSAAQNLQSKDRLYLQALARDTWRYFERCVGPEDNHLPPDNLQLVPEPTLAHRTSPTNVGLYLLAVCCAREFGWISTGELIHRLESSLDTIERLPKHEGHLLNWYDTRTLEILQPSYVSAVDSGNLAGLLLAVAQACIDLGQGATDGKPAQAALLRLSQRCQSLYSAMDFRGLYDSKRHLFHIGLRVQEQVLDASYYDLLASESRLTSFLAIAKGDVPRRHWAALGRPFLSVGVVPGLKSWSGSMFEYLMPSLLMHEPEHGLLNTAASAAVSEQRAFGAAQQLPWGVSESAYFAQDHSLAFQYSPFGVPRLALRRTPPTDRVVAPYATLLATALEPREAVLNLQQLERLGARGELGLFESLDFTVSRQSDDQAFSVVEAYMAHHQGMALAALCNVLCGDAPRRWFSADPQVAAHEALLHERTPRQIVESAEPRLPPEPGGYVPEPVFQSRDVNPLNPGWQPTHLLSNGRYSVALRANGAGVSRWSGRNVTRWRDDLLRDGYGSFFYLRQSGRPDVTSLTSMPAPGPGWRYQARFMADRVQFDAQDDDLSATITVLVSPEDDTELRTVTLHNSGRTEQTLELLSCFEAVLADPRADEAHPAFSNLFVQTRWEPSWRTLMLTRQPRLHGDPKMAVAHFLAEAEADLISVDCIVDRRVFAGRNYPAHQPALMPQPKSAEGNPINGLDPVASLRVKLRLAPGAMAKLSFATAAAETEDELAARIDKYLQPMHVERATRMAATLAQVRLRDLALTPEENLALQDLTTALMYSMPRPGAERLPLDQRQLWRFGLSGDKPIVLVHIHSPSGIPLVHSLLRAQPWWAFGGLAVDVVVLNSEPNSYLMPLQRDILALRDRLIEDVQHSFPRNDAAASSAGFYLLREQETATTEKTALAGLARVVLTADGRPLEMQVAALHESWLPQRNRAIPRKLLSGAVPPATMATDMAPRGRFDPANGEFSFELQVGQRTPKPWVNVIANPSFGFQVSETGSGYTWATNSRMHQITPWSNDPVSDPAFEHWLLQDVDSGQVFPLAPSLFAAPESRWRVRHGQGYSVFEGLQGGLRLETTFYADLNEAVKVVQVQVRLEGTGRRRLRAIGMVEWQLGASRGARRTLQTWNSPTQAAVLAQQRESQDGFGGSTAFLALQQDFGAAADIQWTCDRGEFFDALGRLVLPATLGRRYGGALDPCAALTGEFDLVSGHAAEFSFILGHAGNATAAEQMVLEWTRRDPHKALTEVKNWWSQLLGKVQVRTPDPLFDALVNRWLLYQTVVCRLWSKAGFYQAGGAFGFRDQLQDAMALALADPARLREQIMLNASRQFPEGDVQHWWHAPSGEGVRTHFSDDLLWLPYACAHYIQVTDDVALLNETVPFIDGPQIPGGAEDAYYAPQVSAQSATVYEHCARAIDHSLAVGAHGLPLMGTGDWNDGMNRVGHEGRGESIWLGWFLCSVVEIFQPLAKRRGDDTRAARWIEARSGWIAALHDAGWDGAWFRRAFFDNGAPLGSAANSECRIDLIAQAWAVLSGASTPAFTIPAMHELKRQLIDEQAGLLRLLDPPLRNSENNPGYIQAYPPGVRENGGQYSHAGVWALMAQALSGDTEGAWQSFQDLSPAHRSQHAQRGPAYELEPYVMAGDVYSAAPYIGRGGWSWYTGSAAWLYRAALETLLGLAVRPGRLSLSPRLPAHWPAVEIRLQLQGRDITVHWQRDAEAEPSLVADQLVAWGEWVELDALPARAVLLVRGEAVPTPQPDYAFPSRSG